MTRQTMRHREASGKMLEPSDDQMLSDAAADAARPVAAVAVTLPHSAATGP